MEPCPLTCEALIEGADGFRRVQAVEVQLPEPAFYTHVVGGQYPRRRLRMGRQGLRPAMKGDWTQESAAV